MIDPISSALGDNIPEPLQDENTSEAIVFGPAYSWVKDIMWIWDEIEEYLRRKADSLEGQIMDREWAYDVMVHNPYLINARSPPVNEVSRLNDLFTLRSLCKCVAAIDKIAEYRKQNTAWARMKGAERYVKGMEGRGITEAEWGAANSAFNMEPITYDNVHGIGDSEIPEENVEYILAMKAIMGPEEFESLEDRVMGRRPDMPDVPVMETEEETVDTPDIGFVGELSEIFTDPVSEATEYLRQSDDECSQAAEFWTLMDVDNRGIIDSIIEFAEAAA